MTIDLRDVRSTIVPKSDQLNADQIVAGPIIITVTDVSAGSKDQPLIVHYEGEGGRPYKPGLTMRKVLVLAWGPDTTQWVGKSMELFHEPSVKFGGELVGGIRISRMSDIPKDIKVSLAASKGKKALHEISVLRQSKALEEALAAIAGATGRDSMKDARALAEAIKDPTELASAREAYRLRVAALKEGAKKPEEAASPPSPSFIDRIAACADLEALQVLSDEAETMPEGDDKAAAMAALVRRDAELAD